VAVQQCLFPPISPFHTLAAVFCPESMPVIGAYKPVSGVMRPRLRGDGKSAGTVAACRLCSMDKRRSGAGAPSNQTGNKKSGAGPFKAALRTVFIRIYIQAFFRMGLEVITQTAGDGAGFTTHITFGFTVVLVFQRQ
jgi:hypothetical protein